MGNIKQINIKNRTLFFFNEMINIKAQSRLAKNRPKFTQKHSYVLHWIHHNKQYQPFEGINSVNPLHLMIHGVIYGQKNKGKCSVFNPDNALIDNKKAFWEVIKNEIKVTNGDKEFEYNKSFTKIKFDLDDDFPLNKQLKFPTMAISVRPVFEKYGEYYPQIYEL